MIHLWWHNRQKCMWEFRTEDTPPIALVADEVIWDARERSARAGLQSFLVSRGLLPLPNRAFDFEGQ